MDLALNYFVLFYFCNILRQLQQETASMRGSQMLMQVSSDQAQLFAMLVQILGEERCIEVGVYTVCPSFFIHLALVLFMLHSRGRHFLKFLRSGNGSGFSSGYF
ncbi:hypothetical protein VIGAN_03240000 [Vigna angularis var. angularis]|uniref:Uncharacterized protein n=1 Tax=Vigna angularis var. angularis TaxID=157739 RepID=A0A0S3RP56_PHAAN|nr:hypothetical protein VIGAN_03240000 [Vigna angularis var. angularis]